MLVNLGFLSVKSRPTPSKSASDWFEQLDTNANANGVDSFDLRMSQLQISKGKLMDKGETVNIVEPFEILGEVAVENKTFGGGMKIWCGAVLPQVALRADADVVNIVIKLREELMGGGSTSTTTSTTSTTTTTPKLKKVSQISQIPTLHTQFKIQVSERAKL